MKPFYLVLTLGLALLSSTFAAEVSTCNAAEADRVVATAEQYLALLKGPSQEKANIQGLVGRVLKGKSQADFETLSNDRSRRLIFLMGADGLEELIGLKPDQVLTKIGYTDDYVQRLKREGQQFKLVVFRSQGEDGLPATWDNVAKLVAKAYPSVAAKVLAALPELKKASFESLQSQAPASFAEVDKAGKTHPHFMDEERLAQSESKPWQVRAFLFHAVRLMDLYAGDGITRDKTGKKGLKEFIIPNKRISELPGAVVVDL